MKSESSFVELLKENKRLQKLIKKQNHILGILKRQAKIVDTYDGVHDKPVRYCDIIITVYDEDPDVEDVKAWLEEK